MSGGGGFMQSMNSSFRNNRNLLKNKRLFKENSKHLIEQNSNSSKFKIKKATEEELKIIHEKRLLEEHKKVQNIYLFLTVLLISISFFAYITFFTKKENEYTLNETQQKLKDEYLFDLKIGGMRSESKQWEKAIDSYTSAIKSFPEGYKGHYKLIWAMTELYEKEKNVELANHILLKIERTKQLFPQKEKELNKFLKIINTPKKYKKH